MLDYVHVINLYIFSIIIIIMLSYHDVCDADAVFLAVASCGA